MDFDWRAIADHVWDNRTVPEACELLGYDFAEVYADMRSAVFRRLYVDVAMIATAREELIEEMESAGPTDSHQ